jgi:hypothetical protein
MARKPTTAASASVRTRKATARAVKATSSPRSTVVIQARIDSEFAEELLARDANILGLDGASELVREGLRLVHRQAQEQALINAYDAFYEGKRAPLPAGVTDTD